MDKEITMERKDIIDKIVMYCKDELDIDTEITEKELLSEVGIDSIGLMMLIVYLEEEFHIDNMEDLLFKDEKEITFSDLLDYITQDGEK